MKRNRKADGHIYDLVRSLSPHEKKIINLKLNALSGRKKKVSLWLFKWVEKTEAEKDQILRKSFQKNFPTSSFTAIKHYLQEYIIELLPAMEARSISTDLLKSIAECKVLFTRTLYDSCEKLLNSTLKRAYYYEDFTCIIDLLKLKRDIIIKRISNTMKKDLEEIGAELLRIFELQKAILDFNIIHDKLFSLISLNNKNRDAENQEEINSILENRLFNDFSPAGSFHSRLWFFEVHALYSLYIENFEEACDYYLKCIALWEENPRFKDIALSWYISNLTNYLGSAMSAGDYNKFPSIFEKINRIKAHNAHQELKLFQFTAGTEVFYYMNIYDYDKALKTVNRLEKKFKLYQGKFTEAFELVLTYNFIHVYFSKGLYEKVYSLTHRLLKNYNSGIRSDVVENVRIMHMILVFELAMENQILSYRRLFKKPEARKFKNTPERIIFSHLYEIDSEENQKKKKDKIRQMLDLIEKWKVSTEEPKLPGYGELRLWLEAKLFNITPGEANIKIDKEEIEQKKLAKKA